MAQSIPDGGRHMDSAGEDPRPDSLVEGVFAHPLGLPKDDAALEPRISQLPLLVEINAVLARAIDAEGVLGEILERLAERTRLTHAWVYRLHVEDRQLLCIAHNGGCPPARETLALDDACLDSWVVKEGDSIYVPATRQDPRCLCADASIGSEYAVPLRSRSNVLGVLHVASGEPGGIRATTRKLVDQVAAQAALALERSELYRRLQGSEERFRSIFEQGCYGVALGQLDGRISTVNPAFAHLLGYAPEELRGKHFADFTHPEDRAESLQRVRGLLAGEAEHFTVEKRYLRKSGEAIWCSAAVSLVQDSEGQPAHFLVMVQDISERKKAEEERARLQEQLFQAQKMEALGTLAGGIAHDFNNLLSVMLGFASLVRQRLGAGDPLQESMHMIEESAVRAAELTRQLLGFARPEKQQVKLVNVEEVADRVARIVARTFDRRIKLCREKPKDSLWIEAEPSYLEQAMLNLCINARDAMPEGGTLTLSTSSLILGPQHPVRPAAFQPGPYVTISVRDSGAGIEPPVMQRIFEPFFTTKEPGKGTGLGLAIVHGFVKNHGGFLRVESTPGKGAEFILYLPAMPAPKPSAHPNPPRLQRGNGTVLVVDDEPLIRAFAAQGIKGLGYQVVAAECGQQALEIYAQRAQEIDCVLLDLMMPDISGIETFRRMREINPRAKVIFASGYSTGSLLREAPEAASEEFLGKPYTLEGLSAALRKVCSR